MQLINDLSVKLKRYENEINASINRVIGSGWLVLGPEVEAFECAFADYHALKYCVGVANGTDALELALRSLDVKHDSTVATVANAGAYTTSAVYAIGASTHFLEVDKISQCVTLEAVKAAIEVGVDVVVVTHLFGRVVPDIIEIAELCAQSGIPLLEDCAQAHGASLHRKVAGSFGDIASFSFYPTKNLGALGDGGAVITNNQSYAKKVKQLRQYGWKGKYEIGIAGGRNSRLDSIQAALLSQFLPYLDEWNDERLSIALRYNDEITNPAIKKPIISREKSSKPYVAHLYVIQTTQREGLKDYLKEQNILSDVHYPIPDHKQALMQANDRRVSLPVTEFLAQSILTLPCYPGMKEVQISHVIKAVNSWKS